MVTNTMTEGTPIIQASSAVGRSFEARLGPAATPTDAWNLLDTHEAAMLAIYVDAWHETRFHESRDNLERAAVKLPGGASLFEFSVQLLNRILRDSYSSTAFMAHMTKTKKEGMGIFDQNSRSARSVREISNELAEFLQAASVGYFAYRYLDAINSIGELVSQAGASFSELPDNRLVKLTEITVDAPQDSATMTGDARIVLDHVNARLDLPNYQRIRELIDQIEKAISLEAARQSMSSQVPVRPPLHCHLGPRSRAKHPGGANDGQITRSLPPSIGICAPVVFANSGEASAHASAATSSARTSTPSTLLRR